MNPLPLSPISPIDGWAFDLRLREVPGRSLPYLLHQQIPLRLPGSYRPFQAVVPPDQALIQGLTIYDTFSHQVKLIPGSWLYAITCVNTLPALGTPTMYVRITETSTGVPLFADFLGFQGQNSHPIYLSEPRPITEPGLVVVEMSRMDVIGPPPAGIAYQVVLWTIQPSTPVEAQYTECAR